MKTHEKEKLMGKKEVRSQGFSSDEMLEVDKFCFNMWRAAGDSEDLRYKEYFGKFFRALNSAVKFRANSTNRQKLEAKVGRAVLDHILEIKNTPEVEEGNEEIE